MHIPIADILKSPTSIEEIAIVQIWGGGSEEGIDARTLAFNYKNI